ncbi:putative phage protein gp47/JayE [Bradyrhizobium sp. USDA 4501]
MPWATPSLKDVRRLTRDYVLSAIGGVALVPNSAMRIMSDAQAGLAHLTLIYIDWLSKQLLPDTSETEWLDRHGTLWLTNADGSKGRKQATFASGTAEVTAVPGTIMPKGTRMVYSTVAYQTTEEVTLDEQPTPFPLTCMSAGTVGNLEDGTTLSFIDVVPGVAGSPTVIVMTGGTDIETEDQLRERVLFRIQQPPMGGDANDYVAWARAVPGVSRAWCSPLEMGMGTVTVRFMMDELRSSTDGFPLAEDLITVTIYLDTKRPVAVKDFFVVAPIPEPIDFTIHSLTPDLESVRAAIEVSVREMLERKAAPAHAVDGVAQAAQTIYTAWVSEAILNAAGVDSFRLEMDDHYMPSPGHMAVLGTIIYAV